MAIPEIPVIDPVVEIPQSEVAIEPVSPLSPRVKVLFAVNAPFAVKPEVAVTSPEMVGVAVQDVGDTVNVKPLMVVAAPALPRVSPV